MFRFLELSLHGWDLWQQVRVPIDRDVVLLVGPNGSGKTTLLDSIRQLLGARKLSSRRRLQHYLRRADQPALIRAVVSNAATEGGQQPFHRERIFDPEVTLACALVPASGGTPEKRFAILAGRPSVQDLQRFLLDGRDYYPPEQYDRALANAGVSRSLMAVLAIEQGRTHQLFEVSPRDLFLRVLEMLGDKVILDRYAEARRRYLDAQAEVARQANALLTKQAELQQLLREVERRDRWEEQRDKVRELEERLPAARYQKLWGEHQELENTLQALRAQVRRREVERSTWASAVARVSEAVLAAGQVDSNAKEAAESATAAWGDARAASQTANDEANRLEALLQEAGRLPEEDLEALERAQREVARRRLEAQLRVERVLKDLKSQQEEVTALRGGVFIYPEPVRQTIEELDRAGIPCKVLCSAVEDVDESLAESVEAGIGDARFALLVASENEERVCEVARSHRFPGPVYSGPCLDREQQAGPLRLAAGAPSWLPDVIADVSFAPDGSFRDRRGHWLGGSDGRFLGRGALHVALARAEQRLETTKGDATAAHLALDDADRETEKLALSLTSERHRRDLLSRSARLPRAREEAAAAATLLHERDEARRHADRERGAAAIAFAQGQSRLAEATRDREQFEKQVEGEKKALLETGARVTQQASELDSLRVSLTADLRQRAEGRQLDGPETVESDLGRARQHFVQLGEPPPPEVRLEATQLENNVAELERHVQARTREAEAAGTELEVCRARYVEVVGHTLRDYRARAVDLGRGAEIVVEMELPELRNDDALLSEACISPRFGFDGKEPLPMGDSSFSGGQQVVAGLILLMAMAETEGRGFFLLDEPFAHLSIDRVDQVGRFLTASRAQFIITAPTTLDRGQLNPASMVIVLQKKGRDAPFAPPPLVALS